MKEVEVYTDGACRGNPGRGGYGAVLKYRDFRKELSGGFRLTTNNRMEVFAVIAALEALREPCILTIRSDSRYLIADSSKIGKRDFYTFCRLDNLDAVVCEPGITAEDRTAIEEHTRVIC